MASDAGELQRGQLHDDSNGEKLSANVHGSEGGKCPEGK